MARPNNLEAERGLLGAIMAKNDALFDVIGTVTKADFFEPYHGELFTLMRDQIEAGRQASPMTLMHDLTQDRDIGGVSASQYLAQLYADGPDPSVALDLGKAIRDLALKRRLMSAGEELIRTVESAPVTLTGDELRAKYDAIFGSLFASAADLGIRSLGEISEGVLRRVAEATRTEAPAGLQTPLAALQKLVGPLIPGRLIVIAGPPGSGKTSLAQQIGRAVARLGLPVLMSEIEMSGEELAERDLSKAARIAAHKIESGVVNFEEYERLSSAVDDLKDLPFFVDSSTSPTGAMIRGRALRTKRLKGLSLLIVDHLIRMASPDGRLKEHEAIRANLQTLKRTGQDLGVPTIVITQLRAEYTKNAIQKDWIIKRPGQDDLYGGSAIEQEADVLLFVHRPEYLLRRAEPAENSIDRAKWIAAVDAVAGKAELILTKRRGGRGYGIETVSWIGHRTEFADHDRENDSRARAEVAAELPF